MLAVMSEKLNTPMLRCGSPVTTIKVAMPSSYHARDHPFGLDEGVVLVATDLDGHTLTGDRVLPRLLAVGQKGVAQVIDRATHAAHR